MVTAFPSYSDAFLPHRVKHRRSIECADLPRVRTKTSPSPERPHVQATVRADFEKVNQNLQLAPGNIQDDVYTPSTDIWDFDTKGTLDDLLPEQIPLEYIPSEEELIILCAVSESTPVESPFKGDSLAQLVAKLGIDVVEDNEEGVPACPAPLEGNWDSAPPDEIGEEGNLVSPGPIIRPSIPLLWYPEDLDMP
uniref:Uncharacterized protein n=1 Tax=Timema shepardi TaxID=629360 RepID=A0A7R9B6K1_TIMSH|nr:unnamed protein product [Timema shepardi]